MQTSDDITSILEQALDIVKELPASDKTLELQQLIIDAIHLAEIN